MGENVLNKKEYDKEYYTLNKEKIKQRKKDFYLKNKDKIKAHSLNYYEKHKEDRLEYNKKWYSDNPKKRYEYQKTYNNKNTDKVKEYKKKYIKNYENVRKSNDYLFYLRKIIKNNISVGIKKYGYNKKTKTQEILGCSFNEIKQYLESKFEPWMNWGNHGLYSGELNYGWDIDHIIPLSSAKTEDELLKLFHYTNLQPLCGYTNRYIKKNNR